MRKRRSCTRRDTQMPSVQDELETKIHDVLASPKSFDKLTDVLDYIERKQINNSDLVYLYGKRLIDNHKARLGTKVWRIYERTCLAAMQLQEVSSARTYLEVIKAQFPDSRRVDCFTGMLYEAQATQQPKLWDSALIIYQAVLRSDPNNQMALKRQICVLIGKGEVDNAINKLNAYMTRYHNDFEAWKTLAKLHLKQHNYKLAVFALEEVLLSGPDNYTYHTLLAEALYALGGKSNVTTARKHYAMSLTRNSDSNNMRALLGYALCCQQLGPSEEAGLESEVVSRIRDAYEKSSNKGMLDYLEGILGEVDQSG